MSNRLIEGVDYYINPDGLMVFLEAYHKKRGYCCGNGCKHCPYHGQNETPRESKEIGAIIGNKCDASTSINKK